MSIKKKAEHVFIFMFLLFQIPGNRISEYVYLTKDNESVKYICEKFNISLKVFIQNNKVHGRLNKKTRFHAFTKVDIHKVTDNYFL